MAGLYNGYLLEFPQIRVDCFTRYNEKWIIPSLTAPYGPVKPPRAQCYLLSHIHSDHLGGLCAPWTGDIHCTYETKAMLVKLETRREQNLKTSGAREMAVKSFDFLKPRTEVHSVRTSRGKEEQRRQLVDHLKPHAYDDPFDVDVGLPEKVTIILLNANHCPGSAMFLVKNSQKAVLHTGDVRADAPMLYSLKRNPHVSEFLPQWAGLAPVGSTGGRGKGPGRALDRIYLDTSAMMGTGDMPDKESAVRGLLELITMYPDEAVFAINTWTWGWEDVLKGVALTFRSKIHTDRYKYDILAALASEPLLRSCLTTDATATRFHACGPDKCLGCKTWEDGYRKHNADKLIVHVNMVEVQLVAWEAAKRSFQIDLIEARKGQRPWPTNLHCPFARHAPLPELQNLVSTFKPLTLSPNTIYPQLKLLDYILMPDGFHHCLSGGGEQMMGEMVRYVDGFKGQGYAAGCRASGVRLPEREQEQSQFDWTPEQKPTAFSSMPQFMSPLASDRASNVLRQAAGLGASEKGLQRVIQSREDTKRRHQEIEPVSAEADEPSKRLQSGSLPGAATEAERQVMRQRLALVAQSRTAVKAETAMAQRAASRRTENHIPKTRPLLPVVKAEIALSLPETLIERPWIREFAEDLASIDAQLAPDGPLSNCVQSLKHISQQKIPTSFDFAQSGNLLGTLQNALWIDQCLSLALLSDIQQPEELPSEPLVKSDWRLWESIDSLIRRELRRMAQYEFSSRSSTNPTPGQPLDLPKFRLAAGDRSDGLTSAAHLNKIARCADDVESIAPRSDSLLTKGEQGAVPAILHITSADIRVYEQRLVSLLLDAARTPVLGDKEAMGAQGHLCERMLRHLNRHLRQKEKTYSTQRMNTSIPKKSLVASPSNPATLSLRASTTAKKSSNSSQLDTSQFKHLFAQSQLHIGSDGK